MKTLFIIAGILLIISCRISKSENTTNTKKDEPSNNVKQNTNEIETSRYYYSKHFEQMVSRSLESGFNLADQFDSDNSHMIIKAAYKLAMNGDTLVKQKMFDFLNKLANSERNFQVDHSISVLIDYYIGLSNKELFEISIEFLNPKHLYIEKELNSDSGAGDYTSIVFSKLLKTMTKDDREYYNTKFLSLYAEALDKNIQNIPLYIWRDFYPYLKEELNTNHIQFTSK